MNEAELKKVKAAVLAPKASPHFLYLPKKGKNEVLVEFFLQASDRDKRASQLKLQRGVDPFKGILEKIGDGPVTFRIKAEKLPSTVGPDLKKLSRTVNELAATHVGLLGEKESESIRTAGTLKSKIKKALSGGGGDEQDLLLDEEEDIRDPYAQRRELVSEAAAEHGQRLLNQDENIRLIAHQIKGLDQAPLQPLPDEQEEKLRQANRRRVDQDWGVMVAERKATAEASIALRQDILELDEEWERAADPTREEELQARLEEAERSAEVMGQAVASLMERVRQMVVLVEGLLGRPLVGLKATQDDEVELRDQEEPVEQSLEEKRQSGALRVEQELQALKEDEDFALVAEKAALYSELREANPGGLQGEALAQWRSVVAQGLLHTRLPADEVRQLFGEQDLKVVLKKLMKGGRMDGSVARDYVRRAQKLVVDMDRYSPGAYNDLFGSDRPTYDRLKRLSEVDPQEWGSDVIKSGSGEGESVPKRASRRVAVVGGGPVGLVAAIEARMRGAEVDVYEGRSAAYSRGNVLKIDEDVERRLVRAGLRDVLYPEGTRISPPVKNLEDAAMRRAIELGVNYHKGHVVQNIEHDDDTSEVVITLSSGEARAHLAIIAVGSGINKPPKGGNVAMSQLLGVEVQAMDYTDHAIVGVFDGPTSGELPPQRDDLDKAERDGDWVVTLDGPGGTKYRLATITPEEFDRVGQSKEAMREYLLDRARDNRGLAGMQLDEDTMGAFELKLQWVSRVSVPEKRSVLVGDSVSTPHPLMGSGVNTGLSQIGAVGDLVEEMVQRARERFKERDEDFGSYEQEVQDVGSRNTEKGLGAMQVSWWTRGMKFQALLNKQRQELVRLLSTSGAHDEGLQQADELVRLARHNLDELKEVGRDPEHPVSREIREQSARDLEVLTKSLAGVAERVHKETDAAVALELMLQGLREAMGD